MKKMITLITVIAFVLTFPAAAFAESDVAPSVESGVTADTLSDLALSASEATDDEVLKSDVKSFKGKFAPLFEELEGLRTECRGLWTQIAETNRAIKAGLADFKEELQGMDKKEAKEKLAEMKAALEPLHAGAKALRADIQGLRPEKKTEWTNFRTAVKAQDEPAASAALNKIIDLKGQIIAKQKELLALKQQMLEIVGG